MKQIDIDQARLEMMAWMSTPAEKRPRSRRNWIGEEWLAGRKPKELNYDWNRRVRYYAKEWRRLNRLGR